MEPSCTESWLTGGNSSSQVATDDHSTNLTGDIRCWIKDVIHTDGGFTRYCPMKRRWSRDSNCHYNQENVTKQIWSWNSSSPYLHWFIFLRNDTSWWYQILHFLISSSHSVVVPFFLVILISNFTYVQV